MFRPSNLSSFDYPDSLWRVQSLNLLTVQFCRYYSLPCSQIRALYALAVERENNFYIYNIAGN
jgi:hypothetical protein